MKVFITINKCDEKDCSEIAPAFCDECGETFCLTHAETHNCTDESEFEDLDDSKSL